MGEIANFVNGAAALRKRLRDVPVSFYLLDTPSGRWFCGGWKIPAEMAYVDPTPEKLEAAKFGGRFGPKQRYFETKEDGIKAANEMGYFADETGHFCISRNVD